VVSLQIQPPGEDVQHFYQTYVVVHPTARCPHGEGRTLPDPQGVRIDCPAQRDCWLVRWTSAV
jgi:hypothetical protein